jgi:hypothetical protein
MNCRLRAAALWLGLLALLSVAPLPAAALVIHQGDLVISDLNGGRLLLVHVESGTVETITPRAGSGPNLLVAPAGLAMSNHGFLYVVDNSQRTLVRVDPTTGAQTVIADASGPIVFGEDPFGLAFHEGLLWQEFFVGVRSTGAITRVSCTLVSGCSASAISTDPRLASSRGIDLWETQLFVAVESGQGAWAVANSDGAIGDPLYYNDGSVVLPDWKDVSPLEPAFDAAMRPVANQVMFEDALVLTVQDVDVIYGIPFCSSPGTRIMEYLYTIPLPIIPDRIDENPVAIADGTPLRCPGAVAIADDESIFVTDTLLPFPLGGDAQVVWIGPVDAWTQQVVVASLPDLPNTTTMPASMVMSPMTVPEPAVSVAAAMHGAALGILARRRWRRS